MDIKQVKALADILKGSDLNVIEITEGETKIRLEKTPASPAVQQVTVSQPVQAAAAFAAPDAPAAAVQTQAVDFKDMKEFKSPIVGVFYGAPSPDAEPFVKIGSKIKKGDVLCIVEAMKVMNEILAETDGEIFDVCAKDGQIVEFGQTLFKLC